MKKKKLSLNRAIVLIEIAEANNPLTITELAGKTDLPRSTLMHHLEELKKDGLIIEKSAKELKGNKEIGSPVYLVTNKANPDFSGFLKACRTFRDLFK